MGRKTLLLAAVVGIAGATTLSAQQTPQPSTPPVSNEPQLMRQTVFPLPFRVTPAKNPADDAVEVRLEVSTDQGRTWTLYSSVAPQAGAFSFSAPRDGEYWFYIRTVDRQGKVRPDGPAVAGKRILVDTSPPDLQIMANRGPNGEVVAKWQASDNNLDPASFKLEYQLGANQPWQPIAVDSRTEQTTRTARAGSTTIMPPQNANGIVVRASIADRAGNPIRAEMAVDAPPLAGVGNAGAGGPLLSNANAPAVTTVPYSAQRPTGTPGGTAWPTAQPVKTPLTGGTSTNTPTAFGGGAPNVGPTSPSPAVASVGKWDKTQNDPRQISNPYMVGGANVSGAVGAGVAGATSPLGPQPSSVMPPLASKFSTESTGPQLNTGGASGDMIPPGEQPRWVKSTTFELAYDDEASGTGITKVELFGTRDGGKTWRSYGVDPDNRSPMRVTVESEGVYGFRLLIQQGNFGGQLPRPGDLPECWIAVDMTKPSAKLTGVSLSNVNGQGELNIRWEAADAQLSARPISLLFSDRPGGPWNIIAAGLENSGQFNWKLEQRLPQQVYLRLEVRDEAGNLAGVEATDPISLDQNKPGSRIRGVRSLPDDGTAARWQLWR